MYFCNILRGKCNQIAFLKKDVYQNGRSHVVIKKKRSSVWEVEDVLRYYECWNIT
jgi:hypothetical protein